MNLFELVFTGISPVFVGESCQGSWMM